MKRLLLLLLLVAGCRTWEVNAFGVPLGKEPPRYMQASSDDLSSEEKLGVILILAVAVGAGVAVALAAD